MKLPGNSTAESFINDKFPAIAHRFKTMANALADGRDWRGHNPVEFSNITEMLVTKRTVKAATESGIPRDTAVMQIRLRGVNNRSVEKLVSLDAIQSAKDPKHLAFMLVTELAMYWNQRHHGN